MRLYNLIYCYHKITISVPGVNKIHFKTYGETFAIENVRFIPVERVAERFCQMFLDFIWRLLSVTGDESKQSYSTDLLLLFYQSDPKVNTMGMTSSNRKKN